MVCILRVFSYKSSIYDNLVVRIWCVRVCVTSFVWTVVVAGCSVPLLIRRNLPCWALTPLSRFILMMVKTSDPVPQCLPDCFTILKLCKCCPCKFTMPSIVTLMSFGLFEAPVRSGFGFCSNLYRNVHIGGWEVAVNIKHNACISRSLLQYRARRLGVLVGVRASTDGLHGLITSRHSLWWLILTLTSRGQLLMTKTHNYYVPLL